MDCDTKYPVLIVHGVGFRDKKRFNYWGRIPKALAERGAVVLYGNQDSWGSVSDNAAALKENLEKEISARACGKVNIIAHSKGGLDARYMISSLRAAPCVASLTTVATPHCGSKTIDLICRLPGFLLKFAAFFVNAFARACGDGKPDFYTVIRELGTAHMARFNAENPDAPGVYYQSWAAAMKNPASDIVMCFPNFVVGLVEGENDGLLTPAAVKWTNFKGVLRGASRRGVSHTDAVDFRRKNLSKKPSETGVTDIREFYTGVVADLKKMGL